MRGVVGKVQEEGLGVLLGEVLIQKMQRVVGEHIGRVPVALGMQMVGWRLAGGIHDFVAEINIGVGQDREVAVNTAPRPVELVKPARVRAALVRPTEMSFAAHEGGVAGLLEQLGDGGVVGAEVRLVTRQVCLPQHVTDAGLMRVQAGHQTRS